MKRFNFLLTGILVVLLASCSQRTQITDSKPTVKIDTVLSAGGQTALQFPGRVKAAQDISLSFRVSGTILRMYVNDGTYVRTGQLRAELDPADDQMQLDAAEAEYQSVKAEAERVMALYKENVTTPDANDKAMYGLKQITAKYNHAKDQLEYTRLYAPFSGYVQKRLFDSHETIAAGMPVVSIISEGTPEVEINLPAVEYIRRQQFTGYTCTFDIYPGQEYALDLINVTPKANANQLYTMRLQLKKGEAQALPSPGMNTMVTIECTEGEVRHLSVPTGAVLRDKGMASVFLYDASSRTIRRCDVTVTRLLGSGRCLVTAEGLKPGDLIVASGVHHVKDGEQVEPLLPASKTNVGGLL